MEEYTIQMKKNDIPNSEYQNYLIKRDYNHALMKKQFNSVGNMSRIDARLVKPKLYRCNANFVTVYNPVIKLTNCHQK